MTALQFLFATLRNNGIDINAMLSSPWSIIVSQLLMFILPMFIWLFMQRDSFVANMPNWALGGKNIILLIALSFLIQPVMMTISGITSLFVTNDVSHMLYSFNEAPFWLTILAIAITPAICEELVFRGYIQSQYKDRAILKAALINGLFFAIIHLNIHQFVYAFVMGVLFAYLVHYTRSIWAGIITHFIINASQATLFRLLALLPEPYYADAQAAEEMIAAMPISPEVLVIIVFGVIALCLSPVIIILLREFSKHNAWRIARVPEQDNATDEPEEQTQTTQKVDYYAIGVVVLYILLMVVLIVL